AGRDVVDSAGPEVNRHQIERAALVAGQRDPGRQRVAKTLDQLEGVVGTVDTVRLASLGGADYDAWPVDPEGYPRPAPHDLLRLELGPVVGLIQLLPLVEHVLGERALEMGAGHRNRTHVMQPGRLDAICKFAAATRPSQVCWLDSLLGGSQSVEGGEVEPCGVAQPAQPPRRDAETC